MVAVGPVGKWKDVVSKRQTHPRPRAQGHTARRKACLPGFGLSRAGRQGVSLDAEGGAAYEEGSFLDSGQIRLGEPGTDGRPDFPGTPPPPTRAEEEWAIGYYGRGDIWVGVCARVH